MKSKDQILLESLYEKMIKEKMEELSDEKLEDVVPSESSEEEKPAETESGEEEKEEELDTPIEKQADAMLGQGAPEDGMSDSQAKVIEDLIDEKD